MTPADKRRLAADWSLDSGHVRNALEEAAGKIESLHTLLEQVDRARIAQSTSSDRWVRAFSSGAGYVVEQVRKVIGGAP